MEGFKLTDVIPANRKFVGFGNTVGAESVEVLYNTPANGQTTLIFSGINVAKNTDRSFTYTTLPLAYAIDHYS